MAHTVIGLQSDGAASASSDTCRSSSPVMMWRRCVVSRCCCTGRGALCVGLVVAGLVALAMLMMTMFFDTAGQITSYLWYATPVPESCRLPHDPRLADGSLDVPSSYAKYLDVVPPPPRPPVVEECTELLLPEHYPPRYRYCAAVSRDREGLMAANDGVLVDRCVTVTTGVYLQFVSCILTEARIPHVMEHGTLLSSVRGSWVLPFGTDTDLAVFSVDEEGGYPGLSAGDELRAAADMHVIEAFAQFGGTTFPCADGSGRVCTGSVRGSAQLVGPPRYDPPVDTMQRLREAFGRVSQHIELRDDGRTVVPYKMQSFHSDVRQVKWGHNKEGGTGFRYRYDEWVFGPDDDVNYFPAVRRRRFGTAVPQGHCQDHHAVRPQRRVRAYVHARRRQRDGPQL